jgi:hypothetical protein
MMPIQLLSVALILILLVPSVLLMLSKMLAIQMLLKAFALGVKTSLMVFAHFVGSNHLAFDSFKS